VVFVVVLIGEGVAEAETKLKEDAANRAAEVAKRMLSMYPVVFLLLLKVEPAVAVVEVNIKAVVGRRRMLVTAVDKARHDVGEDGEEEDGDCRSGPCTLVAADAAKDEPVVEVDEVDTEVDVIVLLLRARHDDDKRAERVAVHATQDAMLFEFVKDDFAEPTVYSFGRKHSWRLRVACNEEVWTLKAIRVVGSIIDHYSQN